MLSKITFVVFLVLFSSLVFAQSFTFQYSYITEGFIEYVGDIDSDNIVEFVETKFPDTISVYSGIDGSLKYSINGEGSFTNDFKDYSFSLADFNGNGVTDFFLNNSSTSKVVLIDPSTNDVLFEYSYQTSPSGFKKIYLGDFNNDTKLDVLIFEERIGLPHYNLHTVYSTDINVTQIVGTDESIINYKLYNNFPNPFNPSTTIRYSISSPETVSIKMYDITGQLIKKMIKEHNQSGNYEVIWDGINDFGQKISSGTYFYQLTVGNYVETKKMILLK